MYGLGLTNEQVGALTILDALDLFAYWRQAPPVNEIVLAFLGGGKKTPTSTGTSSAPIPSEADLRQMADMLNGRR